MAKIRTMRMDFDRAREVGEGAVLTIRCPQVLADKVAAIAATDGMSTNLLCNQLLERLVVERFVESRDPADGGNSIPAVAEETHGN